jgi:hypothetical protein
MSRDEKCLPGVLVLVARDGVTDALSYALLALGLSGGSGAVSLALDHVL